MSRKPPTVQVGADFGLIKVLRYVGSDNWEYVCKCGTIKQANRRNIPRMKSCGCQHHKRVDFLTRVRRNVEVTASGCWVWNTKNRPKTYKDGKIVGVSREVWKCVHGEIPDGLQVLHNCPGGDNSKCCNPDHLFIGTAADNSADAVSKGRMSHGDGHWNAKLTTEKATGIYKQVCWYGRSKDEVAVEFGVNRSTVHDIVRRATWRAATECLVGLTPMEV